MNNNLIIVIKTRNEYFKCRCGCKDYYLRELDDPTKTLEKSHYIHVLCLKCGSQHGLSGDYGETCTSETYKKID